MIWLIWQYARIVVGAVLLVLDVICITTSVSSHIREGTIRKVAEAMEKSAKLLEAVQKFITALKNAWGRMSPWDMAKAIIQLIRDLQAFGILWTIIESLCSEMSRWDWAKAVLQVSLMITATLASGGLALTVKIAAVVLSAEAFINLIKKVM